MALNEQTMRQLLALVAQLNTINKDIVALLEDRTAQPGFIGEELAAYIFDIQLHIHPNEAGHDGIFQAGPLKGKTVDIKYASTPETTIDFSRNARGIVPDYYLLLHGPKPDAKSKARPFTIDSIFLFEALPLRHHLLQKGKPLDTAIYVPAALRKQAELYPQSTHPSIQLSPQERERLQAIKAILDTPSAADHSVTL